MWEELEPDVKHMYFRQFKYAEIPMMPGQVWTSCCGKKFEVIEDCGNGMVKVKYQFANGYGILIMDKADIIPWD